MGQGDRNRMYSNFGTKRELFRSVILSTFEPKIELRNKGKRPKSIFKVLELCHQNDRLNLQKTQMIRTCVLLSILCVTGHAIRCHDKDIRGIQVSGKVSVQY